MAYGSRSRRNRNNMMRSNNQGNQNTPRRKRVHEYRRKRRPPIQGKSMPGSGGTRMRPMTNYQSGGRTSNIRTNQNMRRRNSMRSNRYQTGGMSTRGGTGATGAIVGRGGPGASGARGRNIGGFNFDSLYGEFNCPPGSPPGSCPCPGGSACLPGCCGTKDEVGVNVAR